jgi:two-component system LytT family response regulator
VDAIRDQRPDLVLLDIQMPELDGFGVVRAVGADQMPPVIFITAYDEHAVRAFEVNALDYLLKPVDRGRFQSAIGRAKRYIRSDRGGAPLEARLRAVLDALGARLNEPERIAVKTAGHVVLIRPDDIDWVEAHGNHVRLHVGKDHYQVRDAIGRMEQRLPQRSFMRIHRSALVNVARIREIHPWFQRDYVVVLASGSRITTGRSYRDRVRALAESPAARDLTRAFW